MGTLKRFSYDNIVIHDPTAPDPVDYDGGGEGGGEGGCTCVKASYIVFLSNDEILKYRDGETDVALTPSDIPATNGLIFIVYVEPDEVLPTYHYYYLTTVDLDLFTQVPNDLYFKGASSTKVFVYDATAGGFVVHAPEG